MKTYQFHPDLKNGGMTNEQRAGWADTAVKAFAEETGIISSDGELTEDLPTAVSDLIADIMHLAGAHGYDPEMFLSEVCDTARSHFHEESVEEYHEGDEPLEDPPRKLYEQEGAEDAN